MGNNRCGIPHITYQSLMYLVTGISISEWGNNHVTGILEYTCYTNTCNINGDPYNKNIETINTCILVDICNSDV